MHHLQTTMSHQLPDKYWGSLGPNGPFLCELLHNHSQLVAQLQTANNNLQTQMLDSPDDVANAASQAVLTVAWMILINVQSSPTYNPHQHTILNNIQSSPTYNPHQHTILTNIQSS